MHRHSKRMANSMPRRGSDSVVIQITTTQAAVEVLDRVVETGFYGTSRAAAAERLLSEGLRACLKEGILQRRQKAVDM